MLTGLKHSSFLEIFQPVIVQFFCSIPLSFTTCGIPFTNILAHLNLLQSSLMCNKFFPWCLHFYFTCLYLTYSIFFSFMNLRIIYVVSILMSFPANYVVYNLLVFLLIDFFLIMEIFLLLYTYGLFSFNEIYLSKICAVMFAGILGGVVGVNI